MFNATEFVNAWNASLNMQNSAYLKKQLAKYLQNKSTEEYIETIMQRENKKSVKEVYVAVRGKHHGGTWMHPMLFLDLAMWLNPSFKYDVIKFVQDKMLDYRDKSAEYYKALGSAVKTLKSDLDMRSRMSTVATALNYIVFNEDERALRNKKATEEEQQELWQTEKLVTEIINGGFIKTFDELVRFLRKKYNEAHNPVRVIHK
jgi:hypothetical protein